MEKIKKLSATKSDLAVAQSSKMQQKTATDMETKVVQAIQNEDAK